MPNTSIAPVGDWLNAGWSLVGAVASIWQALASMSDSIYIKAPGTKGGAAITFPSDISSVPAGAVITSVTIMVRCSTGSGVAPAGVAPSLTLNVAAQDNPGRYTAKTIYPTSTPTDFEVGTYQRDALGYVWDIFRLNFLFCRVFCWIAIFDLIRVHRIWCRINYRVRPTISVDSPSGTIYTPSPEVKWSYAQADGDRQASAKYRIFTADQVSKISFRPETAVPIFEDVVSGDSTSVKVPTSINSNSYWVYVQAVSAFGAKSLWQGRQFNVQGPTPGVPGINDPNNPGAATLSVIPDAESGSSQLTMRDTSNMLSVQAADAESAIDGVELSTSGCSYLRDSSVAYPGGQSSWKMTATAAGTMGLTGDWCEVMPGSDITCRAQGLAAVTSRQMRCSVLFYDSDFGVISTITGTSALDSIGTWNEASVTTTVPDNATYARAKYEVLAVANTEVHWLDRFGLMYGTDTPWSDGGHMSRNLLSAYYSTQEGTAQAGEVWTPSAGSSVGTTTLPFGTGSSGSKAGSITYVGTSPSIGFRAAGTSFTSPTVGSDYTLNKPTGATTGDLMLAFVTSSEYGDITPPVGWDVAARVRIEDGATDSALFVLKRTADAADPSSWTDGIVTVASARRVAYVVAYSGAAPADEQLLVQTQGGSANSTPLNLTLPAINNTDPNAWRVSAFSVSDDQSGGALTANKNEPAAVAQITRVGGNASAYAVSTGSWSISKPSGVQSGDLMVVTAVFNRTSSVSTPVGWTVQNTRTYGSGNTAVTQVILTRYAGSSEPSSWNASGATSENRGWCSTAVAYRNVHPSVPFLDQNSVPVNSGSQLATGTVGNANSLAWRLTSFSVSADYVVVDITSPPDSVIGGGTAGIGGYAVSSRVIDSNGTVGTGSHARVGYADRAFYNGAAWIGILNPAATVPAGVPNETVRAGTAAGASNPYISSRTFDSGGVIGTGSQALTGIWTPGSGTDKNSMVGWQGFIRPAAAVTAGYAEVTTAIAVDVSKVDMASIDDAKHVALTASFIGTDAGTPYLTVLFYRANVLIAKSTEQGSPFDTSMWTKSAAVFQVPEGTTRMAVSLSAADRQVGDVTSFDRVSLAFGQSLVYRPGTSSAVHPIWAKPQIQYSDDDGSGYSEWKDLPGVTVAPPYFDTLSGLAKYTDETPIPLTNRRFRSRTTSYGLLGDLFVSEWGPASIEVSFIAENWWLKSITHPERNVRLTVKWDAVTIATTNTATVFQPLGEKYPVVLTEGYKGDTFSLSLTPVDHDGWVSLRKMIESGETLFLQSDIDHAWFVRPIGDLSAAILATNRRRKDPLRAINIQFVQVAPEK